MNAIDKILTQVAPPWIRDNDTTAEFVLSNLTAEEKLQILAPLLDAFRLPPKAT